MNINAMMAQAKKMQAEMEKSKAELDAKEFKVEKQGITVVVLGNRRVKSVDINEILIDPDDKEMLEDLVIIAINEANELIDQAEAATKASAVPGMPF